MNTCENCQWWKFVGQIHAEQATCPTDPLFSYGWCDNWGIWPSPTHQRIATWYNFGCPHHKPKADWAEKAAERIFSDVMACVSGYFPGISVGEASTEWKNKVALAIREEAAKAGVK